MNDPMVSTYAEMICALDVVHFAKRKLDFVPDEWQEEVMQSSRDGILLCSRQIGKSTIVAIIALHTAIYQPDAQILIVSPSQRQSSELARKVWSFYGKLKNPIKPVSETKLSLELVNGSRIVSLPSSPDTLRGFSSIDLVVLDECAFFKSDDIYTAVNPMLAVSDGRMMLLSSANGKRGFFYDAWVSENPYVDKWMVTVDECPRISDEFLRKQEKKMSRAKFRQEFYCEFNESSNSVFDIEAMRNAFKPEVESWDYLFEGLGDEYFSK